MPWRSWFNTEVYDRFVSEHGIYRWLNARLAERADLPGARRVLDLGCGTGATARACLAGLSREAEIVAVDSSEAMLALARTNLPHPRVRFEMLAADRVDRLDGKFDRVVSNASIWQFPSIDSVFRAVKCRTAVGARFVFNLPADRVTGESAPIHPFQVALLRELEARLGGRPGGAITTVSRQELLDVAENHAFALQSEDRCVYRTRQEELMELMSIPAMLSPLCSELTDEQRHGVWQRACERSEAGLEVEVPWVYFVFERRPDERTLS